jgi:hypothetical protein
LLSPFAIAYRAIEALPLHWMAWAVKAWPILLLVMIMPAQHQKIK